MQRTVSTGGGVEQYFCAHYKKGTTCPKCFGFSDYLNDNLTYQSEFIQRTKPALNRATHRHFSDLLTLSNQASKWEVDLRGRGFGFRSSV